MSQQYLIPYSTEQLEKVAGFKAINISGASMMYFNDVDESLLSELMYPCMGIVAEKSIANYGLLNTTRLNLVYTMAEIISNGLSSLLWERYSKENSIKNQA